MGRPSDVCHGARIECASGGHACGVFMPEHPLHGRNFGVVGTVTSLVDLWADTGRRPRYMRQGRTGLAWPRLRRTCRTACMPRHGQPELSGSARTRRRILPERRTGRGPCPDALPPRFPFYAWALPAAPLP